MKSSDFMKPQRRSRYIFENTPPAAKDPYKQFAIRLLHDDTFPHFELVKLGHVNFNNPVDTKKIYESWLQQVNKVLSNSDYMNITTQPEYKAVVAWLTDRYTRGLDNFEHISGEGPQAIGAWISLGNQPVSVRGANYPKDIFSFRNIKEMQEDTIEDPRFSSILERLKNDEAIEKAKRDSQQIVLIDNKNFFVTIPLNYGACYVFNNDVGIQANYCTGGSSGLSWFNRYAKDGIIIMVLNKNNPYDVNGKWQLHAETNQIVNAMQQNRYDTAGNDLKFSRFFPGLLREIISEIHVHSEELRKYGYDPVEEISKLGNVFPKSATSFAPL
jgi:hypothetical protein